MPDDALLLHLRADHEARHVHQVDERDIEGIAHPHEPGRLVRGVRVEDAALLHRLVGNHADGTTGSAGEPDDDVLRPSRLDLEPRIGVEHRLDDLSHVVGRAGVGRHDLVQARDEALGRVFGLDERRRLAIGRRQVGKEPLHGSDALLVVRDLVIADARLVAVDLGSPHVVIGHALAGRGLDESRAAQRHRGRALDHRHEIREARDVGGAGGAGPEDGGDLRDHA